MIDKARTHSRRNRSVRVFGEMVDLIWISNPEATLRLEELGNEVIESHSVTVLCAYSVGGNKPASVPSPLLACHSHVLSITHADYRCPNCNSPDLTIIVTNAITDELLECRSCLRLHRVEYQVDGTTRLVQV